MRHTLLLAIVFITAADTFFDISSSLRFHIFTFPFLLLIGFKFCSDVSRVHVWGSCSLYRSSLSMLRVIKFIYLLCFIHLCIFLLPSSVQTVFSLRSSVLEHCKSCSYLYRIFVMDSFFHDDLSRLLLSNDIPSTFFWYIEFQAHPARSFAGGLPDIIFWSPIIPSFYSFTFISHYDQRLWWPTKGVQVFTLHIGTNSLMGELI